MTKNIPDELIWILKQCLREEKLIPTISFMEIHEYLHLYLGCDTDIGKLTGINEKSYFITDLNGETIERAFTDKPVVKLFLRKISDLNVEESAVLNTKGLTIGRPRGYSFSPDAILYLLSLRVDLFNLISENMAIETYGSR